MSKGTKMGPTGPLTGGRNAYPRTLARAMELNRQHDTGVTEGEAHLSPEAKAWIEEHENDPVETVKRRQGHQGPSRHHIKNPQKRNLLEEPFVASGCYTMDLYCKFNHEEPLIRDDEGCAVFNGQSSNEVIGEAKKAGWWFHKDGKTTCPKCVGKRRKRKKIEKTAVLG